MKFKFGGREGSKKRRKTQWNLYERHFCLKWLLHSLLALIMSRLHFCIDFILPHWFLVPCWQSNWMVILFFFFAKLLSEWNKNRDRKTCFIDAQTKTKAKQKRPKKCWNGRSIRCLSGSIVMVIWPLKANCELY